MNIQITSVKKNDDIQDRCDNFCIGFHGKRIDDRTEYSTEYLRNNCDICYEFTYNNEELALKCAEEDLYCHEIDEYFASFINHSSILIDITSIDIPALGLLLESLKKICSQLYFIYVEPESYSSTPNSASLNQQFNLSNNILGFDSTGIPTLTQPIDKDGKSLFVFFMGFEEERTANAVEVFDIHNEQGKFIFGVPAYKPHWDKESLIKNINVLKDFKDINQNIDFCGANDVIRCFSLLTDYLKNDLTKLYLLPIGTKPLSFAALLFIISNENAFLLFDHPDKKKGRSEGVGVKHLYKVRFS